MVSIYSSIVVINAFYRDSMYTQCLSMYLIVCLYLLFAKQMIHEVNLLKVCLQRFNVFYSISMSSPITPKGYISPVTSLSLSLPRHCRHKGFNA